MAATRVYLDHNATTPVLPVARAAVAEALHQVGNPSSVHRDGADARRTVDQARDRVADLVGAPASDVIFTSGGTEANNLALLGFDRPVIVSAVEHDSVMAPARLASAGFSTVPVDTQGVLDLDALESILSAHPNALLSLMLANNETGVRQPVREAAQLAHGQGALVHCDAVQGPGKVPVDMSDLGADLLTVSAHKFGGPTGVGALIVRSGLSLAPRQVGGGQEGYRRAGTPNVPGIAGFGAAARWMIESADPDVTSVARRRDRLEAACAEYGAEVVGADAPRLPNTSCLTMPGVSSETQVMAFDLDGIAVSAGAACSSGKVGPSHVLAAMGVADEVAGTAIRVGLGRDTSDAEIDRFVEAWKKLFRRKHPDLSTRLAS